MYVSPRETYAELFARKAEITRELQMRITEELRARELAEREKNRERQEAATWEYIVAAIATEAQIEAFTAKLDRYDAATVEALMENEEALIETRKRLAEMFGNAHRLEDGRMVFETRDGTKVYDEHGNEVSADIITPDQIDDARPKWEDVQEVKQQQKALEEERRQLQEYQEKIDAAREATTEPNVTEDQLKALEEELEAATPRSVQPKVENAQIKNDVTMVPDRKSQISTPTYIP
ncbi:MAG: hypothetical protein QM698_08655 [Micropepsaceae bacterium]